MIKFLLTLGLLAAVTTQTQAADEKTPPVLNHKMKSLAGKKVDLSKYKGKVVLIVNVASKCGATPQYAGLQELQEKLGKDGLVVLGFPCNQFGAQEPGTAKEISEFCTENYGVTFDMFEKIKVNGPEQAPLYKFLTSKESNPEFAGPIRWNFEKFLVSKDGKVVNRFSTGVSPDNSKMTNAIKAELKK